MKIDKALIRSYPFAIRPLSESDGGGFSIEYPDLPGCIADGETPEEALQNGSDAVKAYLLNCYKYGDAVPKPGAPVVNGGNVCRVASTAVWSPERNRKASASTRWYPR